MTNNKEEELLKEIIFGKFALGYLEKSKSICNASSVIDSKITNATNFAFSSEILLKANIIYDDFSKSPLFTQQNSVTLPFKGKDYVWPKIGTKEWGLEIWGLKQPSTTPCIIGDPKLVRQIIEDNNPNDSRISSLVVNEVNSNQAFSSLTFDGSKPTGHSLYAYYQLQAPIAKNLINTEYYCYVEDEIKYCIYALLTEDLLSVKSNGQTILPRDFMENLDAVKSKSVQLRYATPDYDETPEKDFVFLEEFYKSIADASQFRFGIFSKIDKQNYENSILNRYKVFENIDVITQYRLESLFSSKEIDTLAKFIAYNSNSFNNTTDYIVFLNSCAYFKAHIKNKMKINLAFSTEQFQRVGLFNKLIKAYQPFDVNSKRLCEHPAFDTEEKKIFYINKVKELQKEKKKLVLKTVKPNVNHVVKCKERGCR